MLSVPAATNASSKKKDNSTSPIRWTGKASDLVEILYGIDELGCINDGETPLKEIAAYFYKMQERVNRRMDLDEERERMRRLETI